MNPWKLLRREVSGALRSMRYDRAQRQMNDATMVLPTLAEHDHQLARRRRQRLVAASGALVLVAGSVGSYFAVAGGLDALLASGPGTVGLPQAAAPVSPSAAPSGVPVKAKPRPSSTGTPSPNGVRASPSATATPPVPTPAPSCACNSPSPTGGPTFSPSPTGEPSPTPSPTVSPDPSPTSSPADSVPPTEGAHR